MQLTAARESAVTYLPGRELVYARHARQQARALLEAWDLREHTGLGELIVSELATNALCHGEGPICMRLSFTRGDLRVEVHDDQDRVLLLRIALREAQQLRLVDVMKA